MIKKDMNRVGSRKWELDMQVLKNTEISSNNGKEVIQKLKRTKIGGFCLQFLDDDESVAVFHVRNRLSFFLLNLLHISRRGSKKRVGKLFFRRNALVLKVHQNNDEQMFSIADGLADKLSAKLGIKCMVI